jgi:hypothetical protein
MEALSSFKKNNHFFLIFLVFFPYITFGLFASDTSPFYLLTIAFYVFIRSNYSRFGISKALLFSVIIVLIDTLVSSELSILKFSATVIIAEACFHMGRLSSHSFSYRYITAVAIVWFITGLITLVSPELFSSLFYRIGADADQTGAIRGALGLTPEPSYYGMGSAFLYAFSMQTKINRTSDRKLDLPSLLFGISALLSLSLYGLAVLGVLAFKYNRFLSIISLIIGLILLTLIDTSFSRLTLVVVDAISSGGESLLDDSSIMYRVSNFILIYQVIATNSYEINALTSGVTILFANFGGSAFILILLMFLFSSWSKTILRLSSNIFFLPLILVMFFIGPLSNPFFWLYVGSAYKAKKL